MEVEAAAMQVFSLEAAAMEVEAAAMEVEAAAMQPFSLEAAAVDAAGSNSGGRGSNRSGSSSIGGRGSSD